MKVSHQSSVICCQLSVSREEEGERFFRTEETVGCGIIGAVCRRSKI